MAIGKTIPRWLDLLIQLMFVILLEVIPLICGLVTFIIVPDIKISFSAILTASCFAALLAVTIWWLCNTLENYQRVFLFFILGR